MAKPPKAVRARAKRIANKRARREFGDRFLKNLGFESNDFRKGGIVKAKLGLFAGPITAGLPGQAGPGTMPTVEQPIREPKASSPSITVIISQLDKLVKTANKVGILSKEQQEAMLGQIAQARRIAKEQLQENKPTPIPEAPDATNTSDALSPLQDIIEKLAEQLNKLTKTVGDKVDEQDEDTDTSTFMERFTDNLGYGDDYKTYKQRKAAKAARVTRDQLLDKNGNPLRGAARDSRIRRLNAEKATRGGLFKRAASGVKVAGATIASSRLAQSISTGASKATAGIKAGSGAVREAVRKVAGPIVARSLGKTAVKSIPIVGAVFGAGLALDRLVKGDPVGAGLDMMSGLAGPMTAIPALIASLARDIYSSVYGVQPEQDPELAKRMPEVKGAVEELVKDQLGQSVQPKQKPGGDALDDLTIPKEPPVKPQAVKQTAPTLGTPPTPPPVTAPTTSSPSSSPSTSMPSATQQTPQSTPAATQVAAATTGAEITQASMELPVETPNVLGFDQTMRRFVPQTTPTSKSGHVGIGTVPNPDYIPSVPNNLGNLFKVMFFNVNYQEQ